MKDIDWKSLTFGYLRTDYNVRCYYRDGKWGEVEVCSDEYLKLHMAATCLHYGQEAFEGLKAYRCPDGKVRVFRAEENAARLQNTARGIVMPEVPTELFVDMVRRWYASIKSTSHLMRVEQRSICARYYLVLQQAWAFVQQQNIVS